ncbi:DUF1127 domain-containing protein [Vibrio diabolicus]|uniref:DUF1127 domain-containing protein n=1 Tax=Vibrio diabolicus TaxID=50719 RepID=UPI0034D3D073
MENMTHTCERTLPAGHQTGLQLIYSKLASWRRNYKTRRHLRELPEHLWDDIGLDEKEINSEVRKPFWRE